MLDLFEWFWSNKNKVVTSLSRFFILQLISNWLKVWDSWLRKLWNHPTLTMSNNELSANQSCIRGICRYDLAKDFGMWNLNFYQEMAEKKLHRYFPHNNNSKLIDTSTATKHKKSKTHELPKKRLPQLPRKKKNNYLLRAYLIHRLTP